LEQLGDFALTDIDGAEVIRSLRNHAELPGVPIVVLKVYGDMSEATEHLERRSSDPNVYSQFLTPGEPHHVG
jgi:CheY-like chemotaxis protein